MKLCSMSKERVSVIFSYCLFMIFYLVSFALLEQINVQTNMIMSRIDKRIPFCEYFIVPYLFWFVYLVFMAVYFGFFCEDLEEVKRLSKSMMIGMSVFLLISFLFPNGHTLRPVLKEGNLSVELVKWLYQIDTSTNVFPSMHVFCTIAAGIAFLRQENLMKLKGFKVSIHLITILIVFATMFLKQHSVIDVIGAMVLNVFCYLLIYRGKLIVYKWKSIIIHQL